MASPHLLAHTAAAADFFPTGTAGLTAASASQSVALSNGARFDLTVEAVRKRVGEAELRMLAFNGAVPGPTLLVHQGAEVTIHVSNNGDIETTVHWHGLRLGNDYDGVPGTTQRPIPIGGSLDYKLQFADPGIYWYHPHLREDFAQEMGLYGIIIVEPTDPDYWPPVDQQLTLTLDDLLIEGGRLAPFHARRVSHTAMGRFGNTMLINGDMSFDGQAEVGQVIRLFTVNTANTRLFNLTVPGARMKLVGGDSGHFEHETFVETVLLAPSERAVIDLLFDRPGDVALEHRTPQRTYPLGRFTVNSGGGATAAAASFQARRTNPDLTAQRQLARNDFNRVPDKTLAFSSRMLMTEEGLPGTQVAVHHVSSSTETTAVAHGDLGADVPPAPTQRQRTPTAIHYHHSAESPMEWEDVMPAMNRASNRANMIWEIIDRQTGAVNTAIDWTFYVGDRVKIRLVNEIEQDHLMQHPFHIHGAGRFLLLSHDGEPEPNLVWKDTVLVGAGQVVDILLDVSNPGIWMAHCHISEHHEANMMFSFTVLPSTAELQSAGTHRAKPSTASLATGIEGVTP